MRLFGHRSFRTLAALQMGFVLLLAAGSCKSAVGQTAPYVLPYTMSTYVGGNAQYSGAGATCGSLVALDTAGDGCLALFASINGEPHDVRVDARGNVYFLDNSGTSSSVIHRINPFTQLMTIYVGNLVGNKACTPNTTKYGDGCPATDGVANSNTATPTTLILKAARGIGVANNGNLYIASYNDYYDHVILASTGYMQLLAGSGATGYTDGAAATSKVSQTRGIGPDPTGTITYIADDTSNNILRQVYNGNVSSLTALNTAAVKSVVSNTAATSEILDGPEDAQTDSNGNIYIADASNGVIMAIYKGSGSLPGISNPVYNNIYLIAGYYSASASANPYTYPSAPYTATNNIAPAVPALTVSLGAPRKISLDKYNNLYIAASSDNVVYFLDNATGNIRVIAGDFGGGAGNSVGCTGGGFAGDGCAGTLAGFYPNAGNTDLASAPDNQGNLYITDSENANAAQTRIRKQLSGLSFPATTAGTSVTQTIQFHFAPNDTPAVVNPYVIAAKANDFKLGTATCTTQASPDLTTDCLVPVTFTPSQAGYDTATITVTSAKGGVGTYQLTGQGNAAAIAFDPGNIATLAAANKNAQGIALDGAGNAYIADTGNNRILFYNATTGVSTVYAGGATTVCGTAADAFGDGCAATAAKLNAPEAVAIDTTGSVYIADTGNNIIRKVNPGTGIITLYAGGAAASTGGGTCANLTATVTTTTYSPVAIAFDALGDGCPGTQATFSKPSGLAADNLGSLYVADTGNNVIRVIANNGYVFPIAGGGSICSANTDSLGDGCGSANTIFKSPTGLAFDNVNKALIVADTGDSDVRRISLATTYSIAANIPTNILIQPVTKVAGNDQPGTTISQSGQGAGTQLTAPTGVAVDAAGNVYIADTGNASIRVVNAATGIISTIAGINGVAGTGTNASATITQLTTPAAVAVQPNGTLFIVDSGNNRVLSDTRSQITYNFGRTNVGFPSPLVNFTELNIGTSSVSVPAFVQSPTNTQFSFTPAANSTGSIAACAAGAFASGAICNVQAQFTPTTSSNGAITVNETQTIAPALPTGVPTVSLSGTGAVLTNTTSAVLQTSPALPTNSQYGSSVTLTGTVTPAACNTAAPACYPSGTITFTVDGSALGAVTATGNGTSTTQPQTASATQVVSGLSVGNHTIGCNYSGDDFYAASSCLSTTITVVNAATTSTLTVTNNNQPQYDNCTLIMLQPMVYQEVCGVTALTAKVASTTVGTPDGNVSFYNGTTLLASATLNNGSASITLQQIIGATSTGAVTGIQLSDTTLPAGTYTLSCKYAGSGNYAGSTCPGVTFTVLAPTPAITTIVGRGCSASNLYSTGTQVPNEANVCANNNEQFLKGSPEVSVAQGATTDATLFILPTDNLSGNLTFSCAGMPANTICTFSPTSIALAPSATYVTPVYVDVTFWTDLQPGTVPTTGKLIKPSLGDQHRSIALAEMIGWPLTLLGLVGVLKLRRKTKLRGLALVALLSLMGGSALTLSGCAGPGDYKAVLTTAGVYPITITVTNGTVKSSILVYFNVTSPGIAGQEVKLGSGK
jgi:sugar lactone lactonase YvrE